MSTEQIKIEFDTATRLAHITLPNGEVWENQVPVDKDPEEFVAEFVAMIQESFGDKARNFTLLKLAPRQPGEKKAHGEGK